MAVDGEFVRKGEARGLGFKDFSSRSNDDNRGTPFSRVDHVQAHHRLSLLFPGRFVRPCKLFPSNSDSPQRGDDRCRARLHLLLYRCPLPPGPGIPVHQKINRSRSTASLTNQNGVRSNLTISGERTETGSGPVSQFSEADLAEIKGIGKQLLARLREKLNQRLHSESG